MFLKVFFRHVKTKGFLMGGGEELTDDAKMNSADNCLDKDNVGKKSVL